MGSSSFLQCHKYQEFEFLRFSLLERYWLHGLFSYNISVFTNDYIMTCIFLIISFYSAQVLACTGLHTSIFQNPEGTLWTHRISAVPKVYIYIYMLLSFIRMHYFNHHSEHEQMPIVWHIADGYSYPLASASVQIYLLVSLVCSL